mmetsp:Transcript_933/g.1467  ORF Transcript_933/g.1467 Transcript_933/m.1467 type:complete len:125 (+) Transcript_933:199-573(+)
MGACGCAEARPTLSAVAVLLLLLLLLQVNIWLGVAVEASLKEALAVSRIARMPLCGNSGLDNHCGDGLGSVLGFSGRGVMKPATAVSFGFSSLGQSPSTGADQRSADPISCKSRSAVAEWSHSE